MQIQKDSTSGYTSAASNTGGQTSAVGNPGRQLTFNGKVLSPEQQQRLEALERSLGIRLPDNHYWFDGASLSPE